MRRPRSILQTIRAFLLRGTRAVGNALTSHAALTVFGLLLLIASAILLWPRLYDYLAPQSFGFDNRKDIVVGIVQGLGVVAIAVSLFFTYKNWQTSREGQITERFTRAIQQLGDPKLEVRLGGIYALERIARDSPRDHWTIMEVLTAFVRENAHWKDNPPLAQPASIDPAPPRPAITPRTDIQAILTVLRRRPGKARKEERKESHILDLRDTYLRGANLRAAHMEEANLWAAYMEEADLRDVHMEGANLRFAHMWDAHMEGAALSGAHMEGAWLRNAHMEGADLSGATGLTREQLGSAITDKDTILPDYLRNQGGAPPSP